MIGFGPCPIYAQKSYFWPPAGDMMMMMITIMIMMPCYGMWLRHTVSVGQIRYHREMPYVNMHHWIVVFVNSSEHSPKHTLRTSRFRSCWRLQIEKIGARKYENSYDLMLSWCCLIQRVGRSPLILIIVTSCKRAFADFRWRLLRSQHRRNVGIPCKRMHNKRTLTQRIAPNNVSSHHLIFESWSSRRAFGYIKKYFKYPT